MIKRDYSEKRDFIRMTINTPVEVHSEQEGVVAQGVCNDLSGSGMLLTVNKVLPVDVGGVALNVPLAVATYTLLP